MHRADIQKGTSSKSVGSVNTTSELTAGVETGNWLAVGIVSGGVGSDLKTSHGVM
jgi:hypothetical protein